MDLPETREPIFSTIINKKLRNLFPSLTIGNLRKLSMGIEWHPRPGFSILFWGGPDVP